MATKTVTTTTTKIKLSRPAKTKLVGILRGAQTKQRKQALQDSRGTYALYKEKWLKNQ